MSNEDILKQLEYFVQRMDKIKDYDEQLEYVDSEFYGEEEVYDMTFHQELGEFMADACNNRHAIKWLLEQYKELLKREKMATRN